MLRNLDSPVHLLLILVAFILLFGYKKLPDASRSLGRSLRIFKAETKGLVGKDETEASATEAPVARQAVVASPVAAASPVAPASPIQAQGPLEPRVGAGTPVATVPADSDIS